MEKNLSLKVIEDRIFGQQTEDNKLYLVLWERMANNGYILCWAKNEIEAWNFAFMENDAVRHTIIQLDPNNMPVTDGRIPR